METGRAARLNSNRAAGFSRSMKIAGSVFAAEQPFFKSLVLIELWAGEGRNPQKKPAEIPAAGLLTRFWAGQSFRVGYWSTA